jgi:hypothetical protein
MQTYNSFGELYASSSTSLPVSNRSLFNANTNLIVSEGELNSTGAEIFALKNYPANKSDPTQYSDEKNQIQYDPTRISPANDPCKWFIHEKVHATRHASDDGKEYPTNSVERYAYVTQLYHLIKSGVTLDHILEGGAYQTLTNKFHDYRDIMMAYWKDAQDVVDSEVRKPPF